MILFVIVLMFVVSLQVHCKYIQCTDLACHARLQESLVGKECCSSLDRVHIGVSVLWSFRYDVVLLPRSCYDRGPFMFTK